MAAAAAALIAGSVAAPCGLAAAQNCRPLTLIVPYPPGGGVDVMGRPVGQTLSAALGQQVVIENRAGVGGMIGTRDLARCACVTAKLAAYKLPT